jgi:UDP:flavonoid glycosyltransferase YjiC (YdhE family)
VAAERVARAGAGRHLPGYEAEGATVNAAVRALLDDPSYQERARALSTDIRRLPTMIEMARTLETMAQGARRVRTGTR